MGPYRAPAMNLRRCPAKRGRWDLSHLLVLARDPRQRPGLASVPCARGAFAVAGLCDQQRFSLVADPLKACARKELRPRNHLPSCPSFSGPSRSTLRGAGGKSRRFFPAESACPSQGSFWRKRPGMARRCLPTGVRNAAVAVASISCAAVNLVTCGGLAYRAI